jgi:hypothetical protein
MLVHRKMVSVRRFSMALRQAEGSPLGGNEKEERT